MATFNLLFVVYCISLTISVLFPRSRHATLWLYITLTDIQLELIWDSSDQEVNSIVLTFTRKFSIDYRSEKWSFIIITVPKAALYKLRHHITRLQMRESLFWWWPFSWFWQLLERVFVAFNFERYTVKDLHWRWCSALWWRPWPLSI